MLGLDRVVERQQVEIGVFGLDVDLRKRDVLHAATAFFRRERQARYVLVLGCPVASHMRNRGRNRIISDARRCVC